jgi:phosphoribosylformimino-5-aminoimidazole carboxamide ribonucleotide (ProFAR) isomerase
MKTRKQYHIEKHDEGGITRAEAVQLAKAAGLSRVVVGTSIYVGKFAIWADGTKEQHEQFEESLWPSSL